MKKERNKSKSVRKEMSKLTQEVASSKKAFNGGNKRSTANEYEDQLLRLKERNGIMSSKVKARHQPSLVILKPSLLSESSEVVTTGDQIPPVCNNRHENVNSSSNIYSLLDVDTSNITFQLKPSSLSLSSISVPSSL